MKKSVLLAVLLAGMAAYLSAQSFNTGTLIGTATDPSGAVVPGARIVLQDAATTQSARSAHQQRGPVFVPRSAARHVFGKGDPSGV